MNVFVATAGKHGGSGVSPLFIMVKGRDASSTLSGLHPAFNRANPTISLPR